MVDVKIDIILKGGSFHAVERILCSLNDLILSFQYHITQPHHPR